MFYIFPEDNHASTCWKIITTAYILKVVKEKEKSRDGILNNYSLALQIKGYLMALTCWSELVNVQQAM